MNGYVHGFGIITFVPIWQSRAKINQIELPKIGKKCKQKI